MSISLSRFSVYKRRSGIYYIGYYLNGRRCWKSTRVTTRPEALKALTRFRELSQDPTRNLSLRDSVSDFLTYSGANHAEKTTRLFRSTLLRILAGAGRCIPV